MRINVIDNGFLMKGRLLFLVLILGLIAALLKRTLFSETRGVPPPPSKEFFEELLATNDQNFAISSKAPPPPEPNPKLPSLPDRFHYSTSASFTYWYAKEDGLNLAESALLLPSGITVAPPSGSVLKQSFAYQPGFKVGIGMGYLDLWDLIAEYTYFRGSTTTNETAPANTTDLTATGVWNMDDWFLQVTPISYQSLTGRQLSSTWKLSMDLGDLTIGFPYKKKRGLVFSPFGGLRSVWIRQRMNLALTQTADSIGDSALLPPQPLKSYNSSNGWGVGPRLGVKGKYGLPLGLRLDSLLGASLLYTQYTHVRHFEKKASEAFDFGLEAHMNNYDCVRPILDLNLGIGWGMNIYKKYNIDLAASYDFSYFWSQNMMRMMLDEFFGGSASGSLDLYFQGLTITTSFKF